MSMESHKYDSFLTPKVGYRIGIEFAIMFVVGAAIIELESAYHATFERSIILCPSYFRIRHRSSHNACEIILRARWEYLQLVGQIDWCGFHCKYTQPSSKLHLRNIYVVYILYIIIPCSFTHVTFRCEYCAPLAPLALCSTPDSDRCCWVPLSLFVALPIDWQSHDVPLIHRCRPPVSLSHLTMLQWAPAVLKSNEMNSFVLDFHKITHTLQT